MRTSNTRLTNGSFTGVLVLEEKDLPMTPDQVIRAATNSEAVRLDGRERVFFIQFPGSDSVREQSEAALRAGGVLEPH